MFDDDDLPPPRSSLSSSPPSSRPSDNFQPAPRIDTQPEDQPAFRPPFILSLLFSPFNLLYRVLFNSFRLFGALFPFLPRWLNFAASSSLQRSRNTSGRRPLGPKDTAARFIREFEEDYGSHPLPFLENGYNMALERAHRELKFLVIVLLSPEHDDTNTWVKDTLLSNEVTEYLNDPSNEILLWGGNVQDSEAYQVANSLRCTKFPFASVLVHTPSAGSNAMSNIGRIPGNTSANEFLTKLRTAISQNKEPLDRIRTQRAEQQASRTLRQEQDSAYERSLATDRERARQRREAEAARQRAEAEAAARQAAEEKHAHDLAQWRAWRARSLPPEPGADAAVADIVRLSIRLLSGERVLRKFRADADLEEVYAFVECYDYLQQQQQQDQKEEEEEVSEPEGFQHKYGFRLVSPMPRCVYEVDAGGTVKERIGRSGNLMVELINDDEDEDEDDDGHGGGE